MITGIHHVALKVNDFDKAFKFYTETLGLKCLRTWGEGNGRAAMLDTGRGIVELFAGGAAASEGAFFHMALQSNDVEADYRKALTAGATSKMEPAEMRIPVTSGADFHVKIAFVFAPTGEIVEFFSDIK